MAAMAADHAQALTASESAQGEAADEQAAKLRQAHEAQVRAIEARAEAAERETARLRGEHNEAETSHAAQAQDDAARPPARA